MMLRQMIISLRFIALSNINNVKMFSWTKRVYLVFILRDLLTGHEVFFDANFHADHRDGSIQ